MVIVGGPSAGLFFEMSIETQSGDVLRKRWSEGVAWVMAATPEALIRMVREASRDGVGCAVLLPLVPSGDDDAVMRSDWKSWRIAIARCAVGGQPPVPTYAAVYACLGGHGRASEQVRSLSADAPFPQGRVAMRQAAQTLRLSGVRHFAEDGLLRERLVFSVLDWAGDAGLLAAIEEVANTPPFFLAGLLLVDETTTVPHATAWMRWVVARTGLHLELPPPRPGVLSLPALRVAGKRADSGWTVAQDERRTPNKWLRRGLVFATALASTALVTGIPYWRVSQDLKRFSEVLGRYAEIPESRILLKCDALLQVTADLNELNHRLAQGGVKTWVHEAAGADNLRAAMVQAVAAYRPPQTSLRIDSTANFDTGDKRMRRATAQRLLEPVAALLKANPDLRVQIVGHSDSTGAAQDNLALSLARAEAVRDELVLMTAASPQRFAVFGKGSAQPRADNASASGRALNRRVEISLLPPMSARFACDAFASE